MKQKLLKLQPYLVIAFIAMLLVGMNWKYFFPEPKYDYYQPYHCTVPQGTAKQQMKAKYNTMKYSQDCIRSGRMKQFEREHQRMINEYEYK